MKEIFLEAILDSFKVLPFLFIAFLMMEFFEHKLSNKSKKTIEKSGKFGSIVGGILGAFPQCGFSVAATNLYAGKLITIGTLIAVYLSTSDEMVPILLSENVELSFIFKILGIKVLIAIIFGFIIDMFCKNRKDKHNHINEMCEDEHCGCEKNIFLSTLKHTIHITLFIFIANLILNGIIHFVGPDAISKMLMKNTFFEPLFTSLLGLIPNCASSVIITELYLSNSISFGAMLSGLLTGSGVALVVLFKVNKSIKENIKILCTIYFIGVLIGVIFNLLNIAL